MLQLKQVSLQRGEKILLEQADLTIHAHQKVGIVGSNGVGKTSLFKLFLGELIPEQGEIEVSRALKWAVLKQELPSSSQTALQYALLGDETLTDTQQQLQQAEASNDGIKIAELHHQLAVIDGYSAESRAAKILIGLGFSQQQLTQAVDDFSGGWRMRLNLAQLLMSRADIMLLDEPTNHLDLEGILWLERWLADCQSTLLIISHDRQFLDVVATDIVHCEQRKLKFYSGNYSAFEKQYAENLALQQATFTKLQKKREHIQKFVDRFRYKASKARQAQSRLKMLERMGDVAAVQLRNPFQFQFLSTASAGNPALKLTNVSVGYNHIPLLTQINLSLSDGDRIGLLGPNGAGKSTFIKLLADKLLPLTGEREVSAKLKIGYFTQHQVETLNDQAHAVAHLKALDNAISESTARNYLGKFNFSGDMVFTSVKNYSGGERARLALALLIYNRPNLLLLDEPTNHLDMEMREALINALQDFSGALVLVSHDRYLLASLVDEYWLVANSWVQPFSGDMSDYQNWVKKHRESVGFGDVKINKPAVNRKQIDKKISQLESKLTKLQSKFEKLNITLSDSELYAPEKQQELLSLQNQHKKLQQEIQTVEETLFSLMLEKEED